MNTMSDVREVDAIAARPRAGKATTDQVYLRPEVKIELLACGWYVWSHLIGPASHAMNIAFRQIPLLELFVANAAIYAAAAANPAFVGGSFVALKQSDEPRVRALLAEINQRCSHIIAFAQQFRELDRKVQNSAQGFCLDDFYRDLPANLAGLVELVYDVNSHPKTKVFEELLYAGGLDNRGLQQVYLHTTPSKERSFFMSTPRLEDEGSVLLDMSFTDPRLDALSSMRSRPGSLSDITRQFINEKRQVESFRGLFTPQAPSRKAPNYSGDGVRVRYFGHACVLVQSAEVSVLVDPTCAWERDNDEATLTFSDLPDFIDYVVLSHGHQDHVCPEVLVQLRRRIGQVIVPRNNPGNLPDPSLRLMFGEIGFSNVRVADPLDSIQIPGGQITSLPFPGEHCDLDVNGKQCFFITVKGRRMVFLVNSDAVDPALYRRLATRIGKEKLDILFIGMECHGAPLSWLYGPLLTKPPRKQDDESRRLNGCTSERAWGVVQEIPASRAYVYAMGQERWLEYLMGLEYQPDSIQIIESNRFVDKCRDAGMEAARLRGCREWIL